MKILVLNAGSSSLKYSLFNGADSHLVAHGVVDHLGEQADRDHLFALKHIEQELKDKGLEQNLGDCDAIGHRVVHGGEAFHAPVRVTSDVINTIDALSEIAPLHNPANLIPIQLIAQHFPELPQVAVFDTAFHQTLPDYAFHYALPKRYYKQHQIRRYGFHGTSHQYIAKRLAKQLGKPLEKVNLISMHLGNGASVCAIENGQSIDTSMGFTPLEGLIMGTRTGDLDPSIPIYMMQHLGMDVHEVDMLMNKQSGLLGLAGQNDMRSLLDNRHHGDADAELAIKMFNYRLIKIVGSYLSVMDSVDALVFTGGIGEHAAEIRQAVIAGFGKQVGLALNAAKNENLSGERCISAPDSRFAIWVIPTDEEWEIAQQTLNLVNKPTP